MNFFKLSKDECYGTFYMAILYIISLIIVSIMELKKKEGYCQYKNGEKDAQSNGSNQVISAPEMGILNETLGCKENLNKFQEFLEKQEKEQYDLEKQKEKQYNKFSRNRKKVTYLEEDIINGLRSREEYNHQENIKQKNLEEQQRQDNYDELIRRRKFELEREKRLFLSPSNRIEQIYAEIKRNIEKCEKQFFKKCEKQFFKEQRILEEQQKKPQVREKQHQHEHEQKHEQEQQQQQRRIELDKLCYMKEYEEKVRLLRDMKKKTNLYTRIETLESKIYYQSREIQRMLSPLEYKNFVIHINDMLNQTNEP